MHLPLDLVLEVVKHVDDLDVRRAFGVFGRLSHQQLSLDLQLKPIETGYMTESDSWVRWVVGEKTYRLCRFYRRDALREMVVVTANNIYDILWEPSVHQQSTTPHESDGDAVSNVVQHRTRDAVGLVGSTPEVDCHDDSPADLRVKVGARNCVNCVDMQSLFLVFVLGMSFMYFLPPYPFAPACVYR